MSETIGYEPELLEAAKKVRLLVLDVDGVLTNGRIYLAPDGRVTKRFDIRDGHVLVLMRKLLDFPIAWISGRDDAVTAVRGADLHIEHVVQGVHEKVAEAERLAKELEVSFDEIAFMGDDLNDLPLLRRVGLPAAPLDACAEVRDAARLVSRHGGGAGAVRELGELILKAQDRWDEVLRAMA